VCFVNRFVRAVLAIHGVPPGARIEGLDIAQPPRAIGRRLTTCYQSDLPVSEDDVAQVLGMLHVRRLLPLLG
jgi:Mg2+/Co2+ transporter CorB